MIFEETKTTHTSGIRVNGCTSCEERGQRGIVSSETHAATPKVPCRGCTSRNLSGKLGTCKACIFANVLGCLLFWTVFAALQFFYPHKLAVNAFGALAALFTLLLLAHGIAYLVKRKIKAIGPQYSKPG